MSMQELKFANDEFSLPEEYMWLLAETQRLRWIVAVNSLDMLFDCVLPETLHEHNLFFEDLYFFQKVPAGLKRINAQKWWMAFQQDPFHADRIRWRGSTFADLTMSRLVYTFITVWMRYQFMVTDIQSKSIDSDDVGHVKLFYRVFVPNRIFSFEFVNTRLADSQFSGWYHWQPENTKRPTWRQYKGKPPRPPQNPEDPYLN